MSSILIQIMKDRKVGQELTLDTLDFCIVANEDQDDGFEHEYDLRDVMRTRYEHTTYEAEPYFGTVGWFKFTKGKGKKTVEAEREEEGAYECLLLKKVTKVIKDNGSVELNEFAINLPTSLIPILTIALRKVLQLKEDHSDAQDKAIEGPSPLKKAKTS